MTFTTPDFLIFLVLVYGTYWLLPRKGQNLLILAASLIFYGWWDWRYLIMLLFIAGVDFVVAKAMANSRSPAFRRLMLGVSLISNLGALAYFKYFNFFIDSIEHVAAAVNMPVSLPVLQVILPVGISFYTFQALSYTIDVYRKQFEAIDDP